MSDLDRRREEAAELLNQLPDTPLGTSLFNAVARKSITIAFEAVLFRRIDQGIQVYLTQRSASEAYPGQWHCPGSAFRPEEGPAEVAGRLAVREFKRPFVGWRYVDDFFYGEERGWFLSKVYLVEIEGDPDVDDGAYWCPVHDLPDNLVKHHRTDVIPIALKGLEP